MKKVIMNQIGIYLINKQKAFSFICFLFVVVNALNAQLIHPGINHKKSDLERMKYQIKAGIEPWASSFVNLAKDVFSQHTYVVKGKPSMTVVRRGVTNASEYESDMTAAYQNALMWLMTDDQRHADKAIEILNTWSNLKSVPGIPLDVALYVAPMVNTAELIKYSNAGWDEADIQKFSNMLVYPGYSNTTIPDIENDNHTFYWGIYNGDPSRAGNQELAAYKAMMAMGIFLDNEIMYDRALRYVSGLPHRSDDLSYESGPKISTKINSNNGYRIDYDWEQQFTIPDYGYDGVITNYIYDNGQCQESSRDQTHAMYGVSLTAQIAEIAWNQGDDLYSLSDNRILSGLEFHLKYNLSYENSYPDQTEPWEPTVESGEYYEVVSRTARNKSLKIAPFHDSDFTRILRGVNITRPYWETPLNHYKYRMNLDSEEYKWLQRARDLNIQKTGGFEVRSSSYTDISGWGAFTHGRPNNCPGDPISEIVLGEPVYKMNILPTTIEAENFDYFVLNGHGYTYHDMSSSNTGDVYRTDENVDIKNCTEGGYNITDIQNGEWLTYTVNVPVDGTYDISIRYASSSANGNIKFNIGGVDVTTDVTIPHGSPNSTSITDWKDFTVATNVSLTKGVQALKVLFSGKNDSFELDNINININTLPCQDAISNITNFKKGISYKYYEGEWNKLPDFSTETPIKSGGIATVSLNEANITDNFGFVFEGYVYAPSDGSYTFYTNSDDGSSLSIGGVKILNDDGLHDANEVSASICLNKGYHKLKVDYFTRSGSNSTLSVMYKGPDISKTTLPVYVEEAQGPGQFQFLFNNDDDFEGWTSFNNPEATVMSVNSGKLKATYPATNGYLGIQHQAGLEFSVSHPYLAIQLDHLPASRMSFYMANGWYDNDKNGFSNFVNETLNNAGVYVFDLSINGPGFGSSATQIFANGENYTDTNRIIFLVDDGNTSGTTNIINNDILWIKNFSSIENIIEYAGLTLDVDDLKKEEVSIYPNPTTNSFTITKSLGADVHIYDIMGKLLYKTHIKKNGQKIDVSNLAIGIYFVRIYNDGWIGTKKIIVE